MRDTARTPGFVPAWPRMTVGDVLAEYARGWFPSLSTFALFVAGAYLIDQRSTYLGIALVGWSLMLASRRSRREALIAVATVVDTEIRSSAIIELRIGIAEVLSHPAAIGAFEELKGAGLIKTEDDWAAWRDSVVADYRSRHAPATEPQASERDAFEIRAGLPTERPASEHLTFEIRAGQLLKNGEYQRAPAILHEIVVCKVHDKFQRMAGLPDKELVIRVVLLNGVLMLQIGPIPEEVAKLAGFDTRSEWLEWYTLTSFPLLLNPGDHYIPGRFLLLAFYELENQNAKDWKSSKRAWERCLTDYGRVLKQAGEHGEERAKSRLQRGFAAWLVREGFRQVSRHDPAAGWTNLLMDVRLSYVHADWDIYRWLDDQGEHHYVA